MTQDLKGIPYNQHQRTTNKRDTKQELIIAIEDNDTVYIPFREEYAIAIRDNMSTKTQSKKGKTDNREELGTKTPTKDLRPIPYSRHQRRTRNTKTIDELAQAISNNTLTKTEDQKRRIRNREEVTNETGLVFQDYRSQKRGNRALT